MRRTLLTKATAGLLAVAATPGAGPLPGRPSPRVAPPAYYRPVVVGGMAFPVARSNFLSLVTFENNWHDPRLRKVGDRWLLIGVHEGIDIMAERGTPIVSMTAGRVEAVGWTFYSGLRVGIRGTDGRYYFYAHLSEITVAEGQPVEPGTVLGRVGNTGYGDPGTRDQFPPHLHFGILEASGWVNPYPTLAMLYHASVRASRRSEASLARLAGWADEEGWRRALDAVFLPTEIPG